MSGNNNGERARRLMMAALDGEITSEDRRELDRILEHDPDLRGEWKRMSRVKEVTDAMTYSDPPDDLWDDYWHGVYNRVERGIGWIVMSLGAMVLLGYGAWEVTGAILEDTSAPLLVKIAIFAVLIGLVVLLVSVIREKLFTRKRERYKEVKR